MRSEKHGAAEAGDARTNGPSRPEGRWLEVAVRNRAYELYLHRERSGEPGDAVADWVRAEREVCGQYGIRQDGQR